jgi:hypothetical protein
MRKSIRVVFFLCPHKPLIGCTDFLGGPNFDKTTLGAKANNGRDQSNLASDSLIYDVQHREAAAQRRRSPDMGR